MIFEAPRKFTNFLCCASEALLSIATGGNVKRLGWILDVVKHSNPRGAGSHLHKIYLGGGRGQRIKNFLGVRGTPRWISPWS